MTWASRCARLTGRDGYSILEKTCTVCGATFSSTSRQRYDRRSCKQKAARLRAAEFRRSTRPQRYAHYLKLGGSSRPVSVSQEASSGSENLGMKR